MPFVALVLTLALNLLLDDGSGHSRERRTRQVLTGTGVAMLIPLNTWDVPGVLLVVAFVMVLRTQSQATRRLSIGTLARGAAMWALSGAVLVLPFLITAQSQVDGVLPNLFHPTSLSQFALAFGTLLPGVLIAILIGAADGRPSIRAVAAFALVGFTLPAAWLLASGVWTTQFEGGRRWVAEVAPGIAAPLRAAGDRWLAGWPVAAIGIIAIATMGALLRSRSRAGRSNDGSAFLLVLAIVGLLVSLVPEFVYADDAFSNRMNTVFKMYYQAWLLLAVVSAVAIAVALGRAWHLRTMACVALSVLAFGCVYPPIAAWHKVSAVELGGPTLDSMRYLEYFRPDEHAAIAQAAGQSYQADAGLISVATGRPTLLGWQGHESQWRGAQYGTMAAGRAEALASIYNPRSDGDLTATLSAWDVDFVLLSPRERSVYAVTAEHEARLDRVMEIGFARGAVRIYRRRG
jgi:uncharacterized membrane protein